MTGKVILVGAGPGDPGLITMRGARALGQADLVLYDRLANPALLAHVAPHGEARYIGKESDEPGERQAAVNQLLVSEAQQGKTVVRLKGGDPFVFGRGGEELEALVEAGVPFEVVPGVTSAVAAPAYAGIPVTHRGMAAAFTVVSGSEDSDKPGPPLDWAALAKTPGTLVLLMSARRLEEIAAALIRHGRAADTPAAVVRWGTLPAQRAVYGALANIAERAANAGIGAPAVAVIGEVAQLGERLRWFDRAPLFGMRVLVTRPRQQMSALSRLLTEYGAEAVEAPAIEIAPLEDTAELDAALGALGTFDWVVFTSVNGVAAVFERLAHQRRDARAFGGAQVAAVGSATAEALAERGIAADYVPRTFTTAAIADGFSGLDMRGKRVLLPRADIAPAALADALRTRDAEVASVAAYRTLKPADADARTRAALGSGTIGAAAFTSSSTVRNLMEALDGDTGLLDGVMIASIGPVTSAAAVEAGLRVDVEAQTHTVAGLVEAMAAARAAAAEER
ncbi:MAG: uroporphyrinogen-III C-methyltransferase [Chloroflexota bacterium]|nr:uroporphyrinogen-III C-methyltransferase [Chloroflexota bacterium]